MKRRNFLRLTGLGVLGGASLTWLPACDGKDPAPASDPPSRTAPPEPPPADAVRKEIDAAAQLGKPTLVLLIPEADDVKWSRGTFFGVLLRNGGDALFRELAAVHLICATARQVAAVTPLDDGADTAPAVLVERSYDARGRLEATLVPGPVPAPPALMDDPDLDWKRIEEIGEERYRAWVAPATAAIVRAIGGDAERLGRRAARVRKGLGPEELAGIAACNAGTAKPDAALALRAAAVFRQADQVAGRARWSRTLAAAARAAILDQPIPGARWATDDGCAHTIDGVTSDVGIDCGMGFVPAVGRRFLWLFTEND